jgi:hypothetical protein
MFYPNFDGIPNTSSGASPSTTVGTVAYTTGVMGQAAILSNPTGNLPGPTLAFPFNGSNLESITGITPSLQNLNTQGTEALRGSAAYLNGYAPTSNSAVYFPSTGSPYMNLGVNSPAIFDLATSNLFVEAWVYFNSPLVAFQCIAANGPTGSGVSQECWFLRLNSSGKPEFGINSPSVIIATSSTTVTFGTWYHISASYVSTTTTAYIFVNGGTPVSIGSVVPKSSSGSVVTLGAYPSSASALYMSGYIQDLRIAQGTVVPVASFTPGQPPFSQYTLPTYLTGAPAGAIKYTLQYQFSSFYTTGLSGQQAVYLNNSTVTGFGYAKPTSNIVYNTSTLSTAPGMTISVWVNIKATTPGRTNDQDYFVVLGTTIFLLIRGARTFALIVPGGEALTPASPSATAGTWYHVVAVASNPKWYLYINGSLNTTSANPYSDTTFNQIALGYNTYNNGQTSDVLVQDLRIYNTALSASQIQTIYNAGGISQINTALDYLNNIPQLTPATTGQSMACWVKFSTILSMTNGEYFLVWGNSYFYLYNGIWVTNIRSASSTYPTAYTAYGPTAGQWYHVASVFDTAGKLNLYINGSLVATSTTISPYQTPTPRILIGHAEPYDFARVSDISIDDVRLFKTALTAAQVLAIYQIPSFMNAPANSLLNLSGFVNQQPISASTSAQNLYVFPFDDYVNIWIENVGTSAQEPQKITYKIPITTGTTYWTNNNVNKQIVNNKNYDFPFSQMNISVLDRFGTQLNNNGIDWSLSIKVPDIINLDTAATNSRKINGNPFEVSIPLPVFYKNITRVELVSAEIPDGFYNIRSPFNTFVVNGSTYTIPVGNYTNSSLLIAMNSLIVSTSLAFSLLNNRLSLIPAYALTLTSIVSSAAGLYSTRALVSTYSGPVIKIRRNSDNTTYNFIADMYGTLSNVQNSTTIGAFLNKTTGNVVTWYDQSGAGNDFIQATAVSQPQIVLNSGKWVVFFNRDNNISDGKPTFYSRMTTPNQISGVKTIFYVMNRKVNNGSETILGQSGFDNAGFRTNGGTFFSAPYGNDTNEFLFTGGAYPSLGNGYYRTYWYNNNNSGSSLNIVNNNVPINQWRLVIGSTPGYTSFGFNSLSDPSSSLTERAFYGYLSDVVMFKDQISEADAQTIWGRTPLANP